MQVATSGEAGVEMAKGNAKAFPGILRETAFMGNVEAKGNGTVVKKKASGVGWGSPQERPRCGPPPRAAAPPVHVGATV